MENVKQREINKLIIWENIVWILFIICTLIFSSFMLASLIVVPMLLDWRVLATIYTSGAIVFLCLPAVILLGRKMDQLKKEKEVKENGI